MSRRYLGRVLIYSIVGCPHCRSAKHSLDEQKIPYTDVSVDKYEAQVRDSLKKLTGKTTVPQIYLNEVLIGGNEELQKLVSATVFPVFLCCANANLSSLNDVTSLTLDAM